MPCISNSRILHDSILLFSEQYGETPLHYASKLQEEGVEIVRCLVEEFAVLADKNEKDQVAAVILFIER